MRYVLIIPVFLILFSCSTGNRYNKYSLSQIYQVDSLEYMGVNLVPEMYTSGYAILEDGYITLDLKASVETISKTNEYYSSTTRSLDISGISLMQEFIYTTKKQGFILTQNIVNYQVYGKNAEKIQDKLNYDVKSKQDKNNTGLINFILEETEYISKEKPINILDLPPETLVTITSTDPVIIKAKDFKIQLTYFTKYKYIP